MIKERLKQLRKENKDTQQQLADKIDLKQSTIAQFEAGTAKPSDRTIADICRVYGANEDWLKDGKEPKYKEISEVEKMKKIIDDVMESKSEFQRNALYVLATMSEEEWDLIEKMYYKIKQHSKNKADL